MTLSSSGEEYNSHGEHVVEIPIEATRVKPRRSYGTVGVAVGLAVVAALIAGTIAHDNARDDSLRARDEASQREDLRAGWSTLAALASDGARAAENAQANSATAPPANGAQPSVAYQQVVPAAPATVVVVNVPPQAAANSAIAPSTSVYPVGVPVALPTQGAVLPFGAPAGMSIDTSQTAASDGAANSSQLPPTPPTQSLPNGTVPASSPIPAIPNGTVQTAPPSEPSVNGVTPIPAQ